MLVSLTNFLQNLCLLQLHDSFACLLLLIAHNLSSSKGNTMVTAAPKELCLLLYILVCKANLEHIKLLPSKHTTEPALSISNSHHQSIQHTDNMSTSTPSNKESTGNLFDLTLVLPTHILLCPKSSEGEWILQNKCT